MSKRWYVVHAYSGFEKRVAGAIKERIQRFGMEEKFGEILVPTEEVVEMRGGQKRKSERKFFPGVCPRGDGTGRRQLAPRQGNPPRDGVHRREGRQTFADNRR